MIPGRGCETAGAMHPGTQPSELSISPSAALSARLSRYLLWNCFVDFPSIAKKGFCPASHEVSILLLCGLQHLAVGFRPRAQQAHFESTRYFLTKVGQIAGISEDLGRWPEILRSERNRAHRVLPLHSRIRRSCDVFSDHKMDFQRRTWGFVFIRTTDVSSKDIVGCAGQL